MEEFVCEPLRALRKLIVNVLMGAYVVSNSHELLNISYNFTKSYIRSKILNALEVHTYYSPIPNTKKYVIAFEHNNQPYKMIVERKEKRPKNPILSEAMETSGEVLKMWQGPYFDFFGNPPTPYEMGLKEVDVVDRKGNPLHFSLDEPLIFS